MEYFQIRYDSRVVNYERKMFIRLTTVLSRLYIFGSKVKQRGRDIKYKEEGRKRELTKSDSQTEEDF